MFHIIDVSGQAGYPAGKLIHYGAIEPAVAYLSRRISENRSGLATADIERNFVSKELKRRFRQKLHLD